MRNILPLLFLPLLFLGCLAPALPPATTTPEPTLTTSPTATPLPASTASLSPTVTSLPAPGLHEYATRVTVDTDAQVTIRYLIFFPKLYGQDQTRKWPLILFLHGSGEAGSDLNLVKKIGLPARLLQEPEFPFVVVAPQIPAQVFSSASDQSTDPNTYLLTWGWGPWIDSLDSLLEGLETSYAIDRQRVYLTGLSLGGFGAWEYALRYPHRFAAVAPVAGGYRFGLSEAPDNICTLKDTPIWAFHGDADTTVPFENSAVLVKGLRACGSDRVKFTLYPGVGHHDAFEPAYADAQLYAWMLENSVK